MYCINKKTYFFSYYICICLSIILIINLCACSREKNIIDSIIHNYDIYTDDIENFGVKSEVIMSSEVSGMFLNLDGNLLCISCDDTDYWYYSFNNSNPDYPRFKGDACEIHLKKHNEDDQKLMYCDIYIRITLKSARTDVVVDVYSNNQSEKNLCYMTYDNGDFSPNFIGKQSDLVLFENDNWQRNDDLIKKWITAEQLSQYYNRTYEIYGVLCDIIYDY